MFRPLLPDKRGVSILMYHGVDDSGWEFSVPPQVFEKQIHYLREQGYTFLALEQVIEALGDNVAMPNKAVVITFDDGYQSVAENALPLLEKYQIPAVLFVHADRSSQELGTQLPLLSWEDICGLETRGIAIESHSHSHPNFKLLSADEVRTDLELAEKSFVSHMNKKPRFMAYPGGKYSTALMEELHSRGYRGACTIDRGRVITGDDPLKLKRNGIGWNTSWVEFLVRTSHVNDWYERFVNLLT